MTARLAAARSGLLALMAAWTLNAHAQTTTPPPRTTPEPTARAEEPREIAEEPGAVQAGSTPPADAPAGRTVTRPVRPGEIFRPYHTVTYGLRNRSIVQTSSFGESLVPADEALQAQLGLSDGQGLVVTRVAPDSPAEKLGLKKDDILVAMGSKSLESAADFDARVRVVKEAVALTLIRSGKRIALNVEPEPAGGDAREEYYLGIPVVTLDDVLRHHLDIPAGQGLVVGQVQPESPAARAGVERNDILLSVAGHPVAEVKGLRDRVQESGGKPISLSVVRKSKPLTIEVTPERRKPAFALPGDNPIVPDLSGLTGTVNDPFGMYFVGPGAVVGQSNPQTTATTNHLTSKTMATPTLRWVVVQPPNPAEEDLPKRLEAVMKQLDATNRSLAELKALLAKEGKGPAAGEIRRP